MICSRTASISTWRLPWTEASRSMFSRPVEVLPQHGADRKHGMHVALHLDRSGSRRRDTGKNRKQRGLAGAVRADDADAFSLGHVKRDPVQRAHHATLVSRLPARNAASKETGPPPCLRESIDLAQLR